MDQRKPKYWYPRMPKGSKTKPAIRIYKKSEINQAHLELKGMPAVPKHVAAREIRGENTIAIPCESGELVNSRAFNFRLPLRTVGYVLDSKGDPHRLISGLWAVWVIAIIAILGLMLALFSTNPAALSGLQAVGGAQPERGVNTQLSNGTVGRIRIQGIDNLEISRNQNTELLNPSANKGYFLRFTVSYKGSIVHQSPCWIEPGKVDSWNAWKDLKQNAGKTIKLTVETQACRANSFEECNGAVQTVEAHIDG